MADWLNPPEPPEHTDPVVEWAGEQLPTTTVTCPTAGQDRLVVDAEVSLTGPAWAPDARWVAGRCEGCRTYLEIRVEGGLVGITTEEPEEA